MIERILKVIETSKVDGNTEQWFGFPFFQSEVDHLCDLGYEVEVYWKYGQVGSSIVKWENK